LLGEQSPSLVVATREGKRLEDLILSTVKTLMKQMDNRGVSNEDFEQLVEVLHKCLDKVKRGPEDEDTEGGDDDDEEEEDPFSAFGSSDPGQQLCEHEFVEIIKQFCLTRLLTARQAMAAMRLSDPLSLFGRMDTACALYGRMLDPSSFQLIVNTFMDPGDRENICHRLNLPTSFATDAVNVDLAVMLPPARGGDPPPAPPPPPTTAPPGSPKGSPREPKSPEERRATIEEEARASQEDAAMIEAAVAASLAAKAAEEAAERELIEEGVEQSLRSMRGDKAEAGAHRQRGCGGDDETQAVTAEQALIRDKVRMLREMKEGSGDNSGGGAGGGGGGGGEMSQGEGEMSPDRKMKRRQENAAQEPTSASPDHHG
jgi:hypothetical protein